MKINKSLILGDVHLHLYSKFGTDPLTGLSKRLMDQKKSLQEILDIVDSRKIDNIQFMGDWFHADLEISTEVYALTHWFMSHLEQRGVKFYAVRGNHDLVKKSSPKIEWEYSLYPFLKHTNDYPTNIYYGHYDKPVSEQDINGYDLVLMHHTPLGCKLNGYEMAEGFDWRTVANQNKLLLCAHIHQKQQLAPNAHIVGGFIPLDFGDTGPRGVHIWDSGDLEFIELHAPHFFTIDAKNDDGKRSPDHYFRIIGSDQNAVSENEVYVKKPTYFENRIKGSTLPDILSEWLKLHSKPHSYLKPVEPLLQEVSGGLRTISDLILQKVEIENFLSFENATLDIKTGLNLVEGLGGDFSSNGSGKSTLLESIYWGLFGETTKGLTGDDVIRKYPEKQKDCHVVLTILDINTDKTYTITRSRKNGLFIICDTDNLTEGMKQKECQEYLEQFLGFSKETYLSSTFFSQDSLLLLTKVGVAEKNSLISSLLGFQQYDALQNHVVDMIKSTNITKLQKESESEKVSNQIEYSQRDLSQFDTRISDLETKIDEIKVLGTGLKHEIIAKEAQLESLKGSGVYLDTTVLDQQETNIKKALEGAEYKADNFTAEDLQPEMDRLYERIGQLKQEKRYLESQSDSKEIQLDKFDNVKDGQTCTHCGSLVTPEHRMKYVSGLRNEISILIDKIQAISYSELEAQYRSLAHKKLQSEQSYKDAIKVVSDLKNSLIRLNREKQQVIESANKVKQEEIIIKGMKEKLEIYRSQAQDCKSQYLGIEAQKSNTISQIETLTSKLHSITSDVSDIGTQLGVLDFWVEAFSYKGVKALLLDSFCSQINVILSDILLEVSNGAIQCEFSPTTTTKSGESRNKLDLVVYMRGSQQAYDSLSGGEKKRVDIAVALSFSKWLRQQYKLSSSLLGIMIFDELMDSLDASARECILPLLKTEGHDKAIYIISHTNDLGSICDRVIRVKKTNKVSEIV